MQFDRTKFFDAFRTFYRERSGKGLTQSQVDGVEFLLASFEAQSLITSIPQIAYCFATIAHETAWTFQPIKEYRAAIGTRARMLQDRYWPSGFYGRGYVQLTWEKNYETLSDVIGTDLVSVPDRALQPVFAFQILLFGMTQGLFTGKKLNDYINANQKDYQNARRIINGTDKAKPIASLAMAFEGMLKQSAV